MLDVSHLVCLLSLPTLLTWFYLKTFYSCFYSFCTYEIVFCNSKHENGSREKLRVLNGDKCKRRVKVKEFGGEEKLSLDDT